MLTTKGVLVGAEQLGGSGAGCYISSSVFPCNAFRKCVNVVLRDGVQWGSIDGSWGGWTE